MFIFPTIPLPGLTNTTNLYHFNSSLGYEKVQTGFRILHDQKEFVSYANIIQTGSDTYGDTPQEVCSCWTIRACEQRNVLVIVREL
jgi:hypothetical protein